MSRKILAFFAHPDDEAFGVGGTLAHYADQGHTVKLVCATGGESGVNRLDENDLDNLGEVRMEELRRACQVLGIEPPVFLGYRDSGMAGTETNNDPRCLFAADLGEVAGKIKAIIEEEQPDVVITFERHGWYGHPDHVRIYEAVRKAMEEYGEDGPQLFMAAFPAEAARYSAWLLEQAGEEVPGRYRDAERMRYGLYMIPIVVDTSALAARKIAALNEHRTQMGSDGVESRWGKELLAVRTDREYFIPAAHHDALPELVLPFKRQGGLFGEPPPDPLIPYPIV